MAIDHFEEHFKEKFDIILKESSKVQRNFNQGKLTRF